MSNYNKFYFSEFLSRLVQFHVFGVYSPSRSSACGAQLKARGQLFLIIVTSR
jgi:hypothetical protein